MIYVVLLLLLLSRSVVSNSVRPHRWQPIRLPRPWDFPGKNTGVGCHFLLQCMKVKSESEVTQSCPTLSDPMDCSPPGSSVHGISQARVLEWGAIAFSICSATLTLFWFPFAWSIFLSPHFQSVCVPRSEVGLLWRANIGVLFLYPFSQSVPFGWSINPFTFKLIIDICEPITIFFIGLSLILWPFFPFIV